MSLTAGISRKSRKSRKGKKVKQADSTSVRVIPGDTARVLYPDIPVKGVKNCPRCNDEMYRFLGMWLCSNSGCGGEREAT